MPELTPDPLDVFAWIDDAERAREEAGLVRTLRPRPSASPLLDLASNDYLGLSRHPETVRGRRRPPSAGAPEPPARVW